MMNIRSLCDSKRTYLKKSRFFRADFKQTHLSIVLRSYTLTLAVFVNGKALNKKLQSKFTLLLAKSATGNGTRVVSPLLKLNVGSRGEIIELFKKFPLPFYFN